MDFYWDMWTLLGHDGSYLDKWPLLGCAGLYCHIWDLTGITGSYWDISFKLTETCCELQGMLNLLGK